MTIVARECDTFAEITGNRARNNIQETLVPLGADSPYGNPAIPAGARTSSSPVSRASTSQTAARSSPWEFTLGTGIMLGEPDPRYGTLSILTDPEVFRTLTTQSSPALLDERGVATGQQIQGAVTIALTAEELARLNQGRNSLWLQGGTRGNADHRRGRLRLRRAALRHGQPQRRQRRVDRRIRRTPGTCSVTATT